MTWNGIPIITTFFYPPIPIRDFDYQAMLKTDLDNFCGCGECKHPPYGQGASERQAICDLVEQLLEAA